MMNNTVLIKVKKLKQNAILPKQGSEYAAGYDICACLDKEITKLAFCGRKGSYVDINAETVGGIVGVDSSFLVALRALFASEKAHGESKKRKKKCDHSFEIFHSQ